MEAIERITNKKVRIWTKGGDRPYAHCGTILTTTNKWTEILCETDNKTQQEIRIINNNEIITITVLENDEYREY